MLLRMLRTVYLFDNVGLKLVKAWKKEFEKSRKLGTYGPREVPYIQYIKDVGDGALNGVGGEGGGG